MKNEAIDIGIITMDSNSGMFKRCYQSIIERTSKSIPYNIVVQESPEREAVNFNRLIEQFENQYVVYLNDDTEILDPEWLVYLYTIARLPNVGIVGCAEIYTKLDRACCLASPRVFCSVMVGEGAIAKVNWAASYCWMWNRERLGNLRFDENIPTADLCGKGMTDVDACLSVSEQGFVNFKDYRFRIFHEHKQETEEQYRVRIALYPEQVEYMKKKWSDKFEAFYREGVSYD